MYLLDSQDDQLVNNGSGSAERSSGNGQNPADTTGRQGANGTDPGTNGTPAQKRSGRGFASMDPARVSQIASMGGKAAHELGVAHEWTADEARAAGRKGGQASHGPERSRQNRGTGRETRSNLNGNNGSGNGSVAPPGNLENSGNQG